MSEYNAAERKDIREAEKRARLEDQQRVEIVRSLMSLPAGRSYVLSKLVQAHVFHTSFSSDALAMAFAEGERNQGLQLLNDIMATCPGMYVKMMEEQNVRELASSARRSKGSGGDDHRSESRTEDDGTGDIIYGPDEEGRRYNGEGDRVDRQEG